MSSEGKQAQPELFPNFTQEQNEPRPVKKIIFPQKKLKITLPYEGIFLLIIGFMMVVIISFSLGVEKGKRIKSAQLTPLSLRESQEPIRSSQKTAMGLLPVHEEISKEKEALPVDHSRPYTIQVVTYRRKGYAREEMARLEKRGYQPFIITSGEYIQLCVGTYSNQKEARQLQKILKKTYRDCYVRRR